MVQAESVCQDWAELFDGEYLYSNNVWGKGEITTSEQCLLIRGEGDELEHGWSWQWPTEGADSSVKAYPEVIYGHKPWSDHSTTPRLPIQLAELAALQLDYAIVTEATGVYNLSLNLWLTDSAKSTPENVVHQITIQLQHECITPAGKLIGTATIGDQSYDRYSGEVEDWQYTAFTSKSAQPKAHISLKAFLDYLIRQNKLSNKHYLAAIELGNEVASGQGTTWLQKFEITTIDLPPISESAILLAQKVDMATLDEKADFWAQTTELIVPTEAAHEHLPNGSHVRLRAAYDDENIVIRSQWYDSTKSILKEAWHWEGSGFSKHGNEDRLMLGFPIENNPEFSSKGCTAACHNTSDYESDWWMGSEDEDFRYDVWHWKSAVTNPVDQAEDMWLGIKQDPFEANSSNYSDYTESGGYVINIAPNEIEPLFMPSEGSSNLMFSGEEIDLDTDSLTEGDIIPGYILSPFVGSSGDVDAKGIWVDGEWVVLLKRPLDTGNDDDVVFTPPKPVPFGLAITDDAAGLDHTYTPEVLILRWKR